MGGPHKTISQEPGAGHCVFILGEITAALMADLDLVLLTVWGLGFRFSAFKRDWS